MSLWGRVLTLFRPVMPMMQPPGDVDGGRNDRPMIAHSQTRWLQSDVESAVLLADSGDMSGLGRLAQALRRDGVFSGLMSTRAGGLIRLPRVFRGSGGVVAELEPTDDLGLFDRVHAPKELEMLVADGIIVGVGVGEYLTLPDCEEPVFVRLDPQFLRYRWAEDRWYYAATTGLLPITPGDGRWVLHMPGGYQAPWQSGIVASMGRAFVAKEHAYLYRENYSGKLANPARVAVAPLGSTDAQRQTFWQKVMAWGVNTVFGLLPGWDIKLLESNGRGYEVFAETITSADREFAIGVAGQVVTVDGGAGFSNADIHATIRTDLIQGDGLGLAITLNQQGLRPLVNRLFGCGARGVVAWDTRPPVDLKAEADAIVSAAAAVQQANSALQPYGLRVDAREIATRFKIPTFPIELTSDDGDGTDSPDAAAELAAKMTEYGITRCEHGSSNRCRLCGVERLRDPIRQPDGSTSWRVAWRPIQTAPATPPRLELLAGGAA